MSLGEVSPLSYNHFFHCVAGTSPQEGLALSFAACEYLLKQQAFVLLVTHFRELTQLDMYFQVTKYLTKQMILWFLNCTQLPHGLYH